jgi:hypothetical protein
VQGEGVVDAVAEEGHRPAGEALDAYDAGLVFGADPGEHRGGRDRRRESGVVEGVEVGWVRSGAGRRVATATTRLPAVKSAARAAVAISLTGNTS